MESFLNAMNDYRRGLETRDPEQLGRLDAAVQCLNLGDTNLLLQQEQGREAAIFLKETIDRGIVIDLERIPEGSGDPENPLLVWRLRNTDIRIGRVEEGERAGEYLFTPRTVRNARYFYQKVQDLPYLDDSGLGAGYREPLLERVAPEWMRSQYLFLPLWQWIGIALAIFLGLGLKVLVSWTVDLVAKFAARSDSTWDDLLIHAISPPLGYVAAAALWYLALSVLRLDGVALSVASVALQLFLSVVLIWLVYRCTGVLTEYLRRWADRTESTLDDQLVPLFSRTIKIMVVILGVLLAIQNLGINVLSLLAGLGIGGLAFALAARDTVANFFGSLMILFDRPFQVGDWIVVDGAEGTVEEIGFRSTRIRTFYNSVVSIPNSEIANAHIDNMGSRRYRRTRTYLSVTYDTPPETMEAFLEGIKNIIKANPHTRKDYFHCVFHEYGDSGLNILLYFFFEVSNWSEELVQRQNVFLEILRLAKDLGVEFAFPTQTLHVESFPEKKPGRKTVRLGRDKLTRFAEAYGQNGERSHPEGLGLFRPPHREG